MTSRGQVLPWNLGSSIFRGAVLESTVIVRLSLSTVTPAGLSCALAEKVAEKKTTAIIEGRFMRFSNPIVRARNGHTNPKRKRGDGFPRLRFGLMCCTFAHGP